MNINRYVNPGLNSNTYLVSFPGENVVWLIDAGETDTILRTLPAGYSVQGVFVTHSHFDHIAGLNKLKNVFPGFQLFISPEGAKGLYSDKLNLSYYHERPILFSGEVFKLLYENDRETLADNCVVEVIETPGHNCGCLSYKLNNYIFTGDSFIPGYKTVTKLKGGSREAHISSIEKIFEAFRDDTIICPGHGEMISYQELVSVYQFII